MFAPSTFAAGLLLLTQGLLAQGTGPAQDPATLTRAFAQKLATHPYFSRIALEQVESQRPYLFLVQKTGGEDPSRCTQLAERYAEILAPTLELFQKELVAPLQLTQRADQRLVIAVLASPGDLENYERVMNAPTHLEAQGFYDRTLNAAVLCEDPFQRLRSVRELSLTSRHLFVHACQTAWYTGEGHAPLETWVMEGLACEFARRDPESEIEPNADDLRAFLQDLQDERRRWTHARTSEELCTVGEPGELGAFFQAHAALPPPDDLASVRWAFYRQSALWLHFLLEGDERRHRAAALSFLKQAFAGHGELDSFVASLQPTSTGELDDAFVAWALRRNRPSRAEPIDPESVQKALQRGTRSATSAAAPTLAPAKPAALAPTLTVPGLARDLGAATADERLALALYEISRGRARAGIETLDGLARDGADAAMRERAERERRRAAAWVELRDEFLRQRLESGELIEFTYKGNKLKTMVLAFADGELKLEKARAPESLSAEAIDPLELAQQIEPSGGASEWVRIYPYVLRDDPRAKKLLRDDGGEGGALLADLRTDYPARLRLGAVEGRLGELATRKPPSTLKEVRAQLDELADWRRDAEGLPVLAQKQEAVRDHARSLLARELELLAPADLLRGKLETREGDVVRLTYEFEDARELEDFSSEPYPRGARRALGTESSADTPFQIQKGALTAQGQASLRSLIELTAPLSVRYGLKYEEATVPSPHLTCALGICDDGREHFLWAIDTGHLQRYDTQSSDQAHDEDVVIATQTPYAMELRHDGTQVTLFREGKEQRSLTVGSRQSGAFFLCTASDGLVRFERIQIEGRLAPNGLERLKRAWIERGLARF